MLSVHKLKVGGYTNTMKLILLNSIWNIEHVSSAISTTTGGYSWLE